MRNWRQIATALELNIPAADVERAATGLARIETAFGPLIKQIPLETEPALIVPRFVEDSN